MKSNYVITLLLVLGVLFNAFGQKAMPLQITDNGFIFVKATLNDSIIGNFLLDTGGGMHVLSGKYFEKVKSSAKTAGYFTGFRHNGERLDSEIYTIPSLAIDGYEQKNPYIGYYAPLDGYGMDGIISLKMFENQPFTIDFRNKQLILESSESLKKLEASAGIIPFTVQQYRDKALDIFIKVCVNGIPVEAEFDTGSGYNTLMINPFFMDQMNIKKEDCRDQVYNKELNLKDYFAQLPAGAICSAPAVAGKDVSIMFREGLIYEALIGSGWFKDKALTIDIPNQRMLVR
ncbi:MAG: hypothetical protein SFU99_08790 [Saprospiraceae bacterium]|nr:hypothetical protein [Saprospiraceae bacterium]